MEKSKQTVKETVQEAVQEAVQVPAEQNAPAAEKMVRIRLPITREENAPVPVWVNDRSWLIQRGQEVEVPECVAEVLRHREMMQEVCIAYDEQHAQRN